MYDFTMCPEDSIRQEVFETKDWDHLTSWISGLWNHCYTPRLGYCVGSSAYQVNQRNAILDIYWLIDIDYGSLSNWRTIRVHTSKVKIFSKELRYFV